jgi:hypothetical protein
MDLRTYLQDARAATRLRRLSAALAIFSLVALATTTVAHGSPTRSPHAQAPEPDLTSRAWQAGKEVTVAVKLPTVDGPYPARRAVEVYLIGPVDAADPQDDGSVRGPGCGGGTGPCIHVPAHDDAFPATVHGYVTRAHAYGFWVVPSDTAPPGAVLTRDVRPGELPPSVTQPYGHITDLAWAIKVGDRYQPLTSTHWVRWGVRRGWLELDDSVGFGGTAWVVSRSQ